MRATAATGATTLLAVKCRRHETAGHARADGAQAAGHATKTDEAPKLQRLASKDSRAAADSVGARGSRRRSSTASSRRATAEGLRSLLRDGHVNLAARNGDGLTALLVAARLREHEAEAEIIRLLTDAGASVDDIDRLGRGALHLAALAGNPATTRVLLQRGADPRASTRGAAPRRRTTPLPLRASTRWRCSARTTRRPCATRATD